MAKVNVLIEVDVPRAAAFSAHAVALNSPRIATEQATELLRTFLLCSTPSDNAYGFIKHTVEIDHLVRRQALILG